MDLTNPMSSSVSNAIRNAEVDTQQPETAREGMLQAFKAHWPEYLIEATGLGVFMISACVFTVVLFHPLSPVAQKIGSENVRRMFMGLAMGSTSIGITFSRLGKRSGAHINPAITLTFLRLGKVATSDAAFYTLFQFGGGVIGVVLTYLLMGEVLAHQKVNFAITVPGPLGPVPAFFAEIGISFILMSVILNVSNSKRLSRWTGLFAAALVATYIALESPVSGMSMNPARTLGSASVAHVWTSLWIYFTAPFIGMLLAAEVYKRVGRNRGVACAKLHHHNNQRCIFKCNFADAIGYSSAETDKR